MFLGSVTVLDSFAYIFVALYPVCMHVVLLQHVEMILMALWTIWVTNHFPSVLWHCWFGRPTSIKYHV